MLAQSANTIGGLLREAVRTWGLRVAIRRRDGAHRWSVYSWSDLLEAVERTAAGLLDLGLEPGDRVAIVSNTRTEWTTVDYAILSLGCVSVPVYHSVHPQRVMGILNQSRARAVIVEQGPTSDFLLQHPERLRYLEHIITLDPRDVDETRIGLEQVRRRGARRLRKDPRQIEALSARVDGDDLASIVYTSGTTGLPRGVELTHRNILSALDAVGADFPAGETDVTVLFLPLGNAYARMGQFLALKLGYAIAFAQRIDQLDEVLAEVNPTFFFGVPRIFERAVHRANARYRALPVANRRLVRTGVEALEAAQGGERSSVPLKRRLAVSYARRTVLEPLKASFGRRIRFCVSGGAPLSPRVARLLALADTPILQGWGLTETMAAGTLHSLDDFATDTVGRPADNVEVRIGPDGEVLIRGDCVFRGYHDDEEGTAAVLDDKGWFHTGDIGRIGENGHLQISDRKRDILISSGGKRIAPLHVEKLLTESMWIRSAWVFGDGRDFVVALILPQEAALADWLAEHDQDETLRGLSLTALCADPRVVERIGEEIELVNSGLARFESVRDFRLLSESPTVEGAGLTPSLIARRRAIARKYTSLIESMYSREPGLVRGSAPLLPL